MTVGEIILLMEAIHHKVLIVGKIYVSIGKYSKTKKVMFCSGKTIIASKIENRSDNSGSQQRPTYKKIITTLRLA